MPRRTNENDVPQRSPGSGVAEGTGGGRRVRFRRGAA